MTLNEARRELRSIISELWSVENGIRSEFEGIGEGFCADCVANIAHKYEGVLRRLNNVNTNRLADWVNKD